jgi:hypothetical protein
MAIEEVQRRLPIARLQHTIAEALERRRREVPRVFVVLDQQDGLAGVRGRQSRIRVVARRRCMRRGRIGTKAPPGDSRNSSIAIRARTSPWSR